MKIVKIILLIITVALFLIAVIHSLKLLTLNTSDDFDFVISWLIIIFSSLSVASILISRQKNKEIWLGERISKKIILVFKILLSMLITGVIAFVLMVALYFRGF